MSEIIHHNPRLPPGVRRDMLQDPPGAEFKWEGRKFEVVRDPSCGKAVVEVDRFDSESRGSSRDEPRGNQGAGKTPLKNIINFGIYATVAVGTVALGTAAFVSGNAAQSTMLLTAIAAYASAGATYLITRKM